MAHCSRRGDEMLVGDLSHMHVYEQGGSAQASEVTWRLAVLAVVPSDELLACVFLSVGTAGWCPLHHLEHPAGRNVWSGWDGVQNPPRLPKNSLHSLTPRMFGEHAQHSGRLCAAANVPAGGVWNMKFYIVVLGWNLYVFAYKYCPLTSSGHLTQTQNLKFQTQHLHSVQLREVVCNLCNWSIKKHFYRTSCDIVHVRHCYPIQEINFFCTAYKSYIILALIQNRKPCLVILMWHSGT